MTNDTLPINTYYQRAFYTTILLAANLKLAKLRLIQLQACFSSSLSF